MAANQSVDITELPLQQLQTVKQQMEEELSMLTSSFGSLKAAMAKYNSGMESLNEINKKNEDNTILVPLSSSLYVPGKLGNIKTVIVDVGTGYYAEKSVDDAKDFYKRKVDYLKSNIEKLTETLSQKQRSYNVLIDVMQQKVSQIEAQQQGSSGVGGSSGAVPKAVAAN